VESAANYVEPMRAPEPAAYTEPERPAAAEQFERTAAPPEVWSPPPEPPSYREEPPSYHQEPPSYREAPRDDAPPAASPEPSTPNGDDRQSS